MFLLNIGVQKTILDYVHKLQNAKTGFHECYHYLVAQALDTWMF